MQRILYSLVVGIHFTHIGLILCFSFSQSHWEESAEEMRKQVRAYREEEAQVAATMREEYGLEPPFLGEGEAKGEGGGDMHGMMDGCQGPWTQGRVGSMAGQQTRAT